MLCLPFPASRRVSSSCPFKCEFNLRSYFIYYIQVLWVLVLFALCCEFVGCCKQETKHKRAQQRLWSQRWQHPVCRFVNKSHETLIIIFKKFCALFLFFKNGEDTSQYSFYQFNRFFFYIKQLTLYNIYFLLKKDLQNILVIS